MKNIVINNISTSYYITQDGKCYNSITKKYLKGQQNYKNNYISYNLTMPNGTKTRQYAHRLVAIAFLPMIPGKEQVNHRDGNKANNYVDNLEWVSAKENSQHSIDNGLRNFHHVFCFSNDKRLVAEYKNIQEASRATNISTSIISQELQKEIKTLSGGFYWSRENKLKETKDYKNTGKSKEIYQYDLNGKFIMSYPSAGTAARALGLKSHSHISECCRGKLKTYKGFIWRYVEDIVSPSSENQRDISRIS